MKTRIRVVCPLLARVASLLMALLFSGEVCSAQTEISLAIAGGAKRPGEITTVTFRQDGRLAIQSAYIRRELPPMAGNRPIPNIASFSQGPQGIYFCSGLDSMIFLLKEGREQLLYSDSQQLNGVEQMQIRHVEYASAMDRLLFSVVPTPQNENSVPDGLIVSFDPRRQTVDDRLQVRQHDVGNDWWGDFAITTDNVILLASKNGIHTFDRSTSRANLTYRTQHPIQTIVAFGPRVAYVDHEGIVHDVDLAQMREQPRNRIALGKISDLTEIQVRRQRGRLIAGIPVSADQRAKE